MPHASASSPASKAAGFAGPAQLLCNASTYWWSRSGHIRIRQAQPSVVVVFEYRRRGWCHCSMLHAIARCVA